MRMAELAKTHTDGRGADGKLSLSPLAFVIKTMKTRAATTKIAKR
jgi:hypothetical protein